MTKIGVFCLTLSSYFLLTLTFRIVCGTQTKTFNITVEESQIDVEPETEDLALYLTAQGRSNNEETRDVVYEAPTSKFCKKWYYDLEGAYFQFNSNGTYVYCSSKIYRYPDKLYGVPYILRHSGTWKRINKMEIHLQI